MSEESSKKLHELLKKIQNNPAEQELLKYIHEVRNIGNYASIKPLIDILVSTDNSLVYKEISQILFELKDQNCVLPIINSLSDEKTKKHRHILVSALWQSSLNADAYLQELVNVALENDYLTCLEVLTVIENTGQNIHDEDIISSLNKINEHITYIHDDKNILLNELKTILENLLLDKE